MHPYEITPADIARLNPRQLTDLLRILVGDEARRHGIFQHAPHVAWNISAADGGVDGRVAWTGGPVRTDWFPSRNVLFQSKAQDIAPSKCRDEVLKDGRLKEKMQEQLDRDGAYVLFCREAYDEPEIERRVEGFRKGFRVGGHPRADVATVEIYDGSQIARWAAQSAAAVSYVLWCVGRNVHPRWLSWTELARYREFGGSFVVTEELRTHVTALRRTLAPSRKVARIVGIAGVGKTRLAIEAFRGDADDPAQQALSDGFVYIEGDRNEPAVIHQIRTWRAAGVRGVLVVDECSLLFHGQLCKEVEHPDSELSLLTIDMDPDGGDRRSPCISMGPADEETMVAILRDRHGDLPDEVSRRVLAYAGGVPRVLAQLADTDLRFAALEELDDQRLTERLLWGRDQRSNGALALIQTCALFDRVGWIDELADERAKVAQLCSISADEAFAHGERFRARRVLVPHGRYVSVVPRPLALHLAAGWLRKLPRGRAEQILTGLPRRMAEALTRQLEQLHWLPAAQDVVREVCRPAGPFDTFEALNTATVAQILYHLAAIEPEAVLSQLDRVLGELNTDALRGLDLGRRDTVATLERLCWWESTFERAATLMLALAAAENEGWGNNATEKFSQLLRVLLSGTKAPPSARLRVVDGGLASGDPEKVAVVTRALGQALEAKWFMRSGEVHAQGGRPPEQDWVPRTREEYVVYWRDVLARLVDLAFGGGPVGRQATDAISAHLRGLIAFDLRWRVAGVPMYSDALDAVETALRRLAGGGLQSLPKAVESLRSSLAFEGPQLPVSSQERIQALIELLAPKELGERLAFIVTSPGHDYERNERGHALDAGERRARALAQEVSAHPDTVVPHLDRLLVGQQRHGYAFGHALALALADPVRWFETVLGLLRELFDNDQVNVGLAVGMMAGIAEREPSWVRPRLDAIAEDEVLSKWLVEFTGAVALTQGDLDRLLRASRAGRLDVLALHRLAYGSVLDGVDPAPVCEFVEAVTESKPKAAGVLLDVLYMYTWRREERREPCLPTVRRLLLVPGLLGQASGAGDHHHIQEWVKRLLDRDEGDPELSVALARELLRWFDADEDAWLNHSGKELLSVLGGRHGDEVWGVIGARLIGEIDTNTQRLMLALRYDHTDRTGDLVDDVSTEVLEAWAEQAEHGPLLLAELCTPGTSGGPPPFSSWTPLAQRILDRWGDRKEVFYALASNRQARSWSGSAVPLYTADLRAFEELLDHPQAEVRRRAREAIEGTKRAIEDERKRDQEWHM